MEVVSLARTVASSLWKKMWIKVAVKVDNKRSKGDKVSLGDNRGATRGENVFKEFDSVRKCILPSGSLHSNLNRLHSYYWKEKPRAFYLRRTRCIFRASHTRSSYWIPQLAIRRNTLSWSTDSLILWIDSSIESHIQLRNRYRANQTLPVSFASECTAF